MNSEIFKHIECHTGNDLETIGFSGEFENYYISFYGKQSDKYQLVVESFGENVNEEFWEEETPTNQEKSLMEIMIKQKFTDIVIPKIESEEDFDGDYYKLYGLTREMFY